MIAVGSPAPAFAVADAHGKTVTERDLRGTWTVLYFYPRDDTPGCTTEACEFTASIADFEGLDAQVYGASPDTPASHRTFIAKHALEVGLLSDPDHRLLTAYGAWGEKVLYGKKSIGVIRSTVIVDPAGVVAHRWAKVAAKGHAAFVRAKLVELRVPFRKTRCEPDEAIARRSPLRRRGSELAQLPRGGPRPAGAGRIRATRALSPLSGVRPSRPVAARESSDAAGFFLKGTLKQATLPPRAPPARAKKPASRKGT